MKRVIIVLIFIVLAVGVALSSLILLKSNEDRGDFERRFIDSPLIGTDTLDLKLNSFYLVGVDTSCIYLGNLTQTRSLFTFYKEAGKTVLNQFNLADQLAAHPLGLKLSALQNSLFIVDQQKPAIWMADLTDIAAAKEYALSHYMEQHTPLSPVSLACTSFNKLNKQTEIIKLDFADKTSKPGNYKLIAQADGYLCSKGFLAYTNNHLVYAYTFRNQFICLDSNLQEFYRGKTIDANEHINFKVVKLESDSSRNFSKSPLYVNKMIALNESYLFINSGIRAKNETAYAFKNSSAIDVYQINDGRYAFSFYIPMYKGERIRTFKVAGSRMAVLAGNYLLTYNLKFN
uniref:hypothetical protein n=1 Tax=Pedobacter schmidteae TaxID=2201271 RepID=UPI000EADC7EF|nr:hypothetical protein [Pedobacter schmidteae]